MPGAWQEPREVPSPSTLRAFASNRHALAAWCMLLFMMLVAMLATGLPA
jgi:hypothetical protein